MVQTSGRNQKEILKLYKRTHVHEASDVPTSPLSEIDPAISRNGKICLSFTRVVCLQDFKVFYTGKREEGFKIT